MALYLTEPPFDPVPGNCVACFPGYCDAETGNGKAIIDEEEEDVSAPRSPSGILDLEVFGSVSDPGLTGKTQIGIFPGQTVSRFLPRVRLLFSMRRPLLVPMRSLNPCVLFLDTLLG